MKFVLLVVALALISSAVAETYFKETFGAGWEDRWTKSSWKRSAGQAGNFEVSAGDWYGDAEEDKGLKTTQDARFYAISAESKEFSNENKDFVVQFSVKHGQKIDCGGGYLKLMPAGLDQDDFSGDSVYNIMFGPDICGTSTKKVHVIFNYKGENLLTKKDIRCETDQLTHVYTLIVRPDNTYEVRIDGTKKESGSLFADWAFLPEKMIKDPSVSKPSDWVDEAMINDPEDVKPADWDSVPRTIPDPEAEKPDDWDDDADGEWEAPTMDNPEWKGEWKPKKIPNPAYKGKWVHPEIANPAYVEDNMVYRYPSFKYVGIDVWQVKSGSIFDNIILTDSVAEAEALMAETYGKNKDAEKSMFDAAEKKKRDDEEAERKRQEAERKAAEEDEEDEDDEDDEEDHDHDEL